MKSALVLALATAASATVFKASNVESFGASLADAVVADPDAYDGFARADVLNIFDEVAARGAPGRGRRQAVPVDATPDPDRNVTTPENIFVLQCDIAGFQGDCLVFGAGPGKCGMCLCLSQPPPTPPPPPPYLFSCPRQEARGHLVGVERDSLGGGGGKGPAL